MAFNPFHGFRKHQKTVFAILAIICMFTFVLSGGFGKGDALDWFFSKFGATSRQGKVITTLYGNNIYESEVSDCSRLRSSVSDFVQRAIGSNIASTGEEVVNQYIRASTTEEPNPELRVYNSELRTLLYDMLIRGRIQLTEESSKILRQRDPQDFGYRFALMKAQEGQSNPAKYSRELRDQARFLRETSKSLKSKGFNTEGNVLEGAATMLSLDSWRLTQKDAKTALLFGGTPKRQDTLDFMMWLRQADTLGIKLTDADIRNALNSLTPSRPILTGNKLEDQKALVVGTSSRESAYVDLKTIYRGLGDEFRVALAQAIVLGEEPGILASRPNAFRDPLSVTPLEYVDYFRKQRQTASLVLLPLPVSSFFTADLPQPTERELEDFYDRFKSEEPNPARSTPGFKEPQRVRLQWISTARLSEEMLKKTAEAVPLAGYLRTFEDPRKEYYEDRAEARFAMQVASAVGQTPLGFFPAALLARDNPDKKPLSYTTAAEAFESAYDSVIDSSFSDGGKSLRMPSLLSDDPAASLYTAMNLRTVITSMVGQTAPGTSLTQVGDLGALLAWQGASAIRGQKYQEEVIKAERKKRARQIAALVGASVSPARSGSSIWTTAAPWFLAETGMEPVYDTTVPAGAVKFLVMKSAVARKAEQIEREDLMEFAKKLYDTKGEAEKAREIVVDYVQKMRLKNSMGESQFDDDRHTLARDAGVKPLVQFWNSSQGREPRATFEDEVFQPGALYVPRELRDSQRSPSTTVYWKTKNEMPRTQELKEVREKVRRDWQTQEARKRARKEAEKISEELKGKTGKEARQILGGYLSSHPQWGKLIELDNIARMVPLPQAKGHDPIVYEAYTIPEDQIAYPTTGFVDDLLNLKETQASVMQDRPEQHFYVAYVTKKLPAPTMEEALVMENRSRMLDTLRTDQRKERLESLVRDLRRQAAPKGLLDARGRFRLEPGISADDTTTD